MWTRLLPLILLISSTSSHPQNNGNNNLPFPNPIESMMCSRNEHCTAKFEDSECNGRYCQCKKAYILDFNKCLPIILDLTSECKLNAQCAKGLGDLSRCNEESERCECYDTRGNGKNSTAYAPHTCYYRRELGSFCDLNEECKASISPADAVRCDARSRVCVCAEGATCENIPASVGRSVAALTIVLMAIVGVKVVT